jgi:predicted nuclease of predicted toxin-antitoxin system
MKFLTDMGISLRTVDFLRDLGHDATHLHEEGLDRIPDSDILAKAQREECVLLTHDLDFGELVAISEARLPSVVTFRLRNMRPSNVNRHLQAIIEQHREALASGAIITVTEGRIRVRQLPITGRRG